METGEIPSTPGRSLETTTPNDPIVQSSTTETSTAHQSDMEALLQGVQQLPQESAWQQFVRYYLWIPAPVDAQARAQAEYLARNLAQIRAQAQAQARKQSAPTASQNITQSADEELAQDGFIPSGTLLFLLVMLLGYALYWAYLWVIVVIERS